MNRHALVLALMAASGHLAWAADPVQTGIDWLASLDLADMPPNEAQMVCVPFSTSQTEGGPWQVDYTLGFLEDDDGMQIHVRLLDFGRMTIARNQGTAPEDAMRNFGRTTITWDQWTQYGVGPEDVIRKVSAPEVVRLLEEKPDNEAKGARHIVAKFADLTLLAAVLQRRGERSAAETVLKDSRARDSRDWPSDEYFDEALKQGIAEKLQRSVERDFGEVTIPRQELETRLSQIAQHFPATDSGKRAELILGPLRKVIEEEQGSAKDAINDEALAKLPMKERIAALILRLPRQTGYQMSMPGMCDVFVTDPAVSPWRVAFPIGEPVKPVEATTPAGKLLLIGLEAVPQLLESIEDRRPTRAVGFGWTTHQLSSVLDVGDCALQILWRLSGRSFYGTSSFSKPEELRAEMKRNAEAWWNDVTNGKEAEVLDKEISAGGDEVGLGGRPERLAQIAPERLVPAIERGLVKCKDSYNGDILLRTLVVNASEPARALVRKLVTQGRFLKVRMNAALFINQPGFMLNDHFLPPDSAEVQLKARLAMLAEWQKFPSSTERHDAFDGRELAELLGNLASKDLSMLPAIRAEIGTHQPNQRAALINALAEGLSVPVTAHKPPDDPALECFLAEELEDEAFAPDVYREGDSVHGQGARVAEFAAHLLHALWPERYAFTWDGTADDIEKARIACLNAWRVSQQMPPLAPRALALREGDDPATVTSITIKRGKKRFALKDRADAWMKKPLTGEALVRLLIEFAKENEDDARSIRLTATRKSARSGFAIEVTTGTEREPLSNGNSRFDVKLGKKQLMGEYGGMELRLARKADLESYLEFKAKIAEALAAPAESFVFIQAVRLAQPWSKR